MNREDNTPDTPPQADVRPHRVASPHGDRIDPYYWLRDDERRDPAVLAYLEAENAYKERHLAGPLRETIYGEILARLKQDDASVPYFKDGYWYYTRFETGKEHPIFARRATTLDAPEEIVIDGNERAAFGRAMGREYYQLGAAEVSLSGEWLAFCEDFVGRRQYELRFKNLRTHETFEDLIENVESDLAWANDNATVLYVEKDPETLLGLHVKKHTLGANPALDPVVFTQRDTSFYTGVAKSKSERYIFISMESTVSSEWHYADADDPALEFKVFLPHERDHEYQIEHLGRDFIIRTNWRANNFRLMRASVAHAGRSLGLAGGGRAPRRHLSPGFRCVRAVHRPLHPVGRPAENQHPAARARGRCGRRARVLRRERRARLCDGARHEPADRHRRAALQLRLADHADQHLRFRRAYRRASVAEARPGARLVRSRRLPDGVSLGRPRATAGRYRCPWCTAAAWRATAARRSCNTATAPTASRWSRIFRRRA